MRGGTIPTTPSDSDSVAFRIVGAGTPNGNTGNHRQNSCFDLCRRIYIQQRLPGTERAVVASKPQIQFVDLKLFWSDERRDNTFDFCGRRRTMNHLPRIICRDIRLGPRTS